MEPSEETKKPSGTNKVLIAVVVVALLAVVAMAAMMMNQKQEPAPAEPQIGYATDASVLLDQESLQAAFDEANKNAANGSIALRFINDAYSTDGSTFEGLIANSEANKYDMFITIFADAELQDQIFQSGLVPPGSGYEQLTLDHALEKGDHRVYVTVTQVETSESGAQTIVGQFTHTMDFHVVDE